jgi:type IV secretion system protein VirB4
LAEQTILVMDDEIRQARETLSRKVESFVLQLHDIVPLDVVSKAQAFSLFRRLLNFEPEKADAVRLKHDTFVDFYACDSTLDCYRDHLRLDDYYVRVVTLKEPPAHTMAHLLHELQQVPSNLILTSEWRREANAVVRRLIHSKRRHFHNARASLMNYLNAAPTPQSAMLIDDGAVATVSDLGRRDIWVQSCSFGINAFFVTGEGGRLAVRRFVGRQQVGQTIRSQIVCRGLHRDLITKPEKVDESGDAEAFIVGD